MMLDGPFREPEPLCDGGIAVAPPDQLRHLELPGHQSARRDAGLLQGIQHGPRGSGDRLPGHGAQRSDDENMILADVAASGPIDVDHITAISGNAGLLVLIPLPGGLVRMVASLRPGEAAASVADLQRLLDDRGPLDGPQPGRIAIERLTWSSKFHFRHHLAATFRQGRVLLAGDAGHVHSPAGGQGMNLGIRDAFFAAETLDAALDAESSGLSPDRFLDAYAANRRDAATRVIAETNRLNRILFTPPALRPVRNAVLRVAAHTALPRTMALGLSGVLDTGPGIGRAPAPIPSR